MGFPTLYIWLIPSLTDGRDWQRNVPWTLKLYTNTSHEDWLAAVGGKGSCGSDLGFWPVLGLWPNALQTTWVKSSPQKWKSSFQGQRGKEAKRSWTCIEPQRNLHQKTAKRILVYSFLSRCRILNQLRRSRSVLTREQQNLLPCSAEALQGRIFVTSSF